MAEHEAKAQNNPTVTNGQPPTDRKNGKVTPYNTYMDSTYIYKIIYI